MSSPKRIHGIKLNQKQHTKFETSSYPEQPRRPERYTFARMAQSRSQAKTVAAGCVLPSVLVLSTELFTPREPAKSVVPMPVPEIRVWSAEDGEAEIRTRKENETVS